MLKSYKKWKKQQKPIQTPQNHKQTDKQPPKTNKTLPKPKSN